MVSHLTRTVRTCKLNLPINEGQGGTVHDSSGYGNHGTIYGATWVNGSYGYGLYFDGTDDYVDCGSGSSLDITDAITLMAWVKCAVTPTDMESHSGIVAKGLEDYELAFSSNNSKLYFRLIDSTDTPHTISYSSGNLIVGKWYYLAGTYDGKTQILYINGVNQPSVSWIGDIRVTSNSLLIGELSGGNFNGTIAEVLIYNRAWTADEVLSYYNATKGRFGL